MLLLTLLLVIPRGRSYDGYKKIHKVYVPYEYIRAVCEVTRKSRHIESQLVDMENGNLALYNYYLDSANSCFVFLITNLGFAEDYQNWTIISCGSGIRFELTATWN